MAASAPDGGTLPLVVVMGVSGSGKTSVGTPLAAQLGADFVEGDTLHPDENVAKMARGEPLDDADRRPWLDRVGAMLAAARRKRRPTVVSCSALKRAYRDRLRERAGGPLAFVYLGGAKTLVRQRIAARRHHFMPASLLDSQYAALEDPAGEADVVSVDVAGTVQQIVDAALAGLERLGMRPPAAAAER